MANVDYIFTPTQTGEYVSNVAKHVTLDRDNVKKLAESVFEEFKSKRYHLGSWRDHELHPKEASENTINCAHVKLFMKGSSMIHAYRRKEGNSSGQSFFYRLFLADTLNFSFWSPNHCGIKFNNKLHTGFWSIHAAIRRALQEGIPITDFNYIVKMSKPDVAYFLRADTEDPIPMLEERYQVLKEAAEVLVRKYGSSFVNCIKGCNHKAQNLIQIVVQNFSSYNDETEYDGQRVSFYKRAQILVADIWACFQNSGLGYFDDIDTLTCFADYRVPQVLAYFGVMQYSPELMAILKKGTIMMNGDPFEVEIRGCSIAAVEFLAEEMKKMCSDDATRTLLCNNSILDYYLWDYRRKHAKSIEEAMPFHKVRCIYY